MNAYVAAYFGAATLAIVLVPIVSRVAKSYQLVDNPGPRKVHRVPIPRIGGIAFLIPTLAVILPLFFLNAVSQSVRGARTEYIVLIVAASFIFGVGFIDDLRSIPGSVKLACLIVASLAVCASGATLRSFSVGTWFEVDTGWASWPLTVLWITGITVCINLIDGLDGLAAGVAVIVCGAIALVAFLSDQVAMAVLMLALLGSVTGFLFYNFYPAKIFMGDCGALFLGFMIGAGSVVCQAKTSTLVGIAIPFLALGVPILDTGCAMIRRRLFERRSMFAPDRSHLHHILLDLGFSQRTVVLAIYAVTAIGASIGVFMLTMEGKQSVRLLAVGLLVLLSMFGYLHGGRCWELLAALKHNRAIEHEERTLRRDFEIAEVRMREAKSLDAWWETLCDMGKRMHFQTLGLWNRREGRCDNILSWNAPEGKTPNDRTAIVILPLGGHGPSEWEIRAHIGVNGCLEIGGQQAVLLARLMDESPPPEPKEEGPSQTLWPSCNAAPGPRIMEEINYEHDGHVIARVP